MGNRHMPTCEELATENAWLREENRQLREKVVALKNTVIILEEAVSRLEEMVARLSKNSGNASKPPSSDIVSRAVAGAGREVAQYRRAAAMAPLVVRVEFGPDEIDDVRTYGMSECPMCDGAVEVGAGVPPASCAAGGACAAPHRCD